MICTLFSSQVQVWLPRADPNSKASASFLEPQVPAVPTFQDTILTWPAESACRSFMVAALEIKTTSEQSRNARTHVRVKKAQLDTAADFLVIKFCF